MTEKILVSIQLCNILFMIKGEVDASVATLLREHVHVGSWVSFWPASRKSSGRLGAPALASRDD